MDNQDSTPNPAAASPQGRESRSKAAVIEAQDLGFTYRGATAPTLRGTNFRQEQGEFLVMMGGSGAGKSTFCRCLNGLIPNFQKGDLTGSLTVCGESVGGRATHELARKVAMVFQDFEAQLFCTSAELELAFGPENLRVPAPEIRQRIADLLPFLGLAGMERREPATLSGGEKQRLALGAALAMSPQLLVLDEPTSDLDPLGKRIVFDLAVALRRAGMSILMVEHEPEHALEADWVVLLANGKLKAAGPPRHVLSRLDALAQAGVRPPDLCHAFAELGDTDPPFGVEESKQRLLANGWYVDADRYAALVRAEEKQRDSYGDVQIKAEGLTHQFERGRVAVDNVSFEIRAGEFVAIVGQNGSGKTTLINHFNGLLAPTRGVVRIYGKPTTEHSLAQLGRRVGYVFQNPDHQIFAETVFDEVAFAPRNQGIDAQQVSKHVAEALAAVDLTGKENDDPFSLTKGERQRVAVASVLAAKPEILLFDEPTTGLDYRQQRQMMELVRRLNQEGRTVVMVTHNMWTVTRYAHRCLVLQEGKLLAEGPVREIFGNGELLAGASLAAPPLVQFSTEIGATMLTEEELKECLVTGEEQ